VTQQSSIPTFDPVNSESLFLASRQGLHSYGDLRLFGKLFTHLVDGTEAGKERPVCFLADSSDELIFAVASCWIHGIPFCCLNPNATPGELEKQLDLIHPGAVFTDTKHREKYTGENHLEMGQLDLTQVSGDDTDTSTAPIDSDNEHDPEEVFGIFFTSGTTGTPKAVPLKRRQMLYAAHASAQNFRPADDHFWLLCLPLNHIGGISIILRSILYGTGIYRMKKFDAEMVMTFLSENPLFHVASMVPTMLKRLLENRTFHTHNDFRAILLGGGALDQSLVRESIRRGIPLVPSYGMTETCAQVAANPILKPSGTYPPLKSVGTLFEPNEIEIRDSDGKNLGPNNPGTIWLRGPQIFDGYLTADKNNCFDENGWFNTGDFGYLNANRQLFFESRRKDLIVTGGENVSPGEVERELMRIRPVKEAVVIGVKDKEWGQKVVAVITTNNEGKITPQKIRKILKERLSPYKIPKDIVLVDTLPKSEAGKILRNEIIKYFES